MSSLGTDGPKTEVWCGFLGTARDSAHPLLDALPPLLTLDANGGEAHGWTARCASCRRAASAPETVARLAELFLAQAIREYVEQSAARVDGWLAGLSDPAVSKALSIIHDRYAEDLDVERLARESGCRERCSASASPS